MEFAAGCGDPFEGGVPELVVVVREYVLCWSTPYSAGGCCCCKLLYDARAGTGFRCGNSWPSFIIIVVDILLCANYNLPTFQASVSAFLPETLSARECFYCTGVASLGSSYQQFVHADMMSDAFCPNTRVASQLR